MPHNFRTIEQFVQLLEAAIEQNKEHANSHRIGVRDNYYDGGVKAYEHVLSILRTSNIGIVYPPPEQEHGDPHKFCGGFVPVRSNPDICNNCGKARFAGVTKPQLLPDLIEFDPREDCGCIGPSHYPTCKHWALPL